MSYNTYDGVDFEELPSKFCELYGGWPYFPSTAIENTLATESSRDDLVTKTETCCCTVSISREISKLTYLLA